MSMVGETEQPEVQKTMEDMGANLAAISDQYNKRSSELESALAKAVHFQDELMVGDCLRLDSDCGLGRQ